MLYFVFNQETTSVVVALNLDEGLFNLQFPVFPPAERPGDAAAPRNVRREVRALTAAADARRQVLTPTSRKALFGCDSGKRSSPLTAARGDGSFAKKRSSPLWSTRP